MTKCGIGDRAPGSAERGLSFWQARLRRALGAVVATAVMATSLFGYNQPTRESSGVDVSSLLGEPLSTKHYGRDVCEGMNPSSQESIAASNICENLPLLSENSSIDITPKVTLPTELLIKHGYLDPEGKLLAEFDLGSEEGGWLPDSQLHQEYRTVVDRVAKNNPIVNYALNDLGMATAFYKTDKDYYTNGYYIAHDDGTGDVSRQIVFVMSDDSDRVKEPTSLTRFLVHESIHAVFEAIKQNDNPEIQTKLSNSSEMYSLFMAEGARVSALDNQEQLLLILDRVEKSLENVPSSQDVGSRDEFREKIDNFRKWVEDPNTTLPETYDLAGNQPFEVQARLERQGAQGDLISKINDFNSLIRRGREKYLNRLAEYNTIEGLAKGELGHPTTYEELMASIINGIDASPDEVVSEIGELPQNLQPYVYAIADSSIQLMELQMGNSEEKSQMQSWDGLGLLSEDSRFGASAMFSW